MNILDLPEADQKAMAAEDGMTIGDWKIEQRRLLADSADAIKELDAHAGLVDPGWTDEDTKRFQDKIDSGNPD